MIVYPFARIRISTNDTLDSIAAKLSEKLFGGSDFEEVPGLYDEVPALRLKKDFMGLFVAVHGHTGEYMLDIEPRWDSIRKTDGVATDISNYIAYLIRTFADWHVEVPKA